MTTTPTPDMEEPIRLVSQVAKPGARMVIFRDATGKELTIEAEVSGFTLRNYGDRQWCREDMRDWAESARDDEEPPFNANGWEVVGADEPRGVVVIMPEHPSPGNDRFLLALERLGGARKVVETLAIGADRAQEIMEESRRAEADDALLRALMVDSWDMSEPYHIPNAGWQAPPPRREWWASHPAGARGNVPPRQRMGPKPARVTADPDKKRARKAQDKARKANRSRK